MTAKITTLIDKYDNIELIRDKTAVILFEERDNQKELAIADGQDSAGWDFDIYIERSSPWELIEDANGEILKQTPLINVYWNNSSIDESMSDSVSRQTYNSIIHIDCLSAKVHEITDGQIMRADELASKDAQRIARLVRNILSAAVYKQLDMTEVVHNKKIQSITMFQPQINDRPAQHCVGARLVLQVLHNEYSPEYDAPIMEIIMGEMTRGDDGLLYSEQTYDVEEET